METVENTARMSKCPNFDGCSAPKCPLDEFMVDRAYLCGEPKCIATKRIRFNIGKDMPNMGLLPMELKGYREFYGNHQNALGALFIKFAPIPRKK